MRAQNLSDVERDTGAGEQRATSPAPVATVVRNLILLGLVGVGISWWFLRYTDWFPLIGGFLGLGGVFAWLAFVSNLISEDTRKQIHAAFDAKVVQQPRTGTWALLAGLAFVMAAATRGTIVLTSTAGDVARHTEIRDEGNESIAEVDVPASGEAKVTIFVPWRRIVIVKPAGLPPASVVAHSWRRTDLAVPSAFFGRPVILAHAKSDLTASAGNQPMRIKAVVIRDGNPVDRGQIAFGAYQGESFWVGCAPDVRVPQYLEQRWRALGDADYAIVKWMAPKSILERPLIAGDVVELSLTNAENGTTAFARATVLPVAQQQFPQEVVLVPNGG